MPYTEDTNKEYYTYTNAHKSEKYHTKPTYMK